ncbi:MAG: hypothetical protein AAGE98_09660 [Actinomycetota bacterium]
MTEPTAAPDDAAAYIARVRAEIEADAERRRRQEPEIQRREREIERAWIDVAPPGAAGEQGELLLDRAERLSMIDVDAPLGAKPGVRHVKGTIRKATYWYLRYVTDQVNALSNVLVRLVRRLDERVSAVEAAVGTGALDALIDPVPEPGSAVATAVAAIVPADGPVFVGAARSGVLVRPIHDRGQSVHGVDHDPLVSLPGVRDGLDLRAGDPVDHLDDLEAGSLSGIVLAGFVEDVGPTAAWSLIASATRALAPTGAVVVVTGDPADREPVERDLRQGRGLAPETWAHLIGRAGFDVDTVAVDGDDRIGVIVVGRPG